MISKRINLALVYLMAYWFLSLIWQERYYVRSTMISCNRNTKTSMRIALLGDPQLIDRTTYSHPKPIIDYVAFETDTRMKRQFKSLLIDLKPEIVVSLGDMLHGGRDYFDEKEWEKGYERYADVFKPIPTGSDFLFLNVCGNHDIPWRDPQQQPFTMGQYRKYFGKLNNLVRVKNVEFIIIHSVGLESQSTIKELRDETQDFISNYKSSDEINVRILFTHIPLWRPESVMCSPTSTIDGGQFINCGDRCGKTWREMMDQDVSERLVATFKPTHVFSGDFHEQCDVNHLYENQNMPEKVRETTVATFNPLNGRSHSALTMFYVEENGDTILKFCILPSLPWLLYAWRAFVTIVLLRLSYFRRFSRPKFLFDLYVIILFGVILYYGMLLYDYNS